MQQDLIFKVLDADTSVEARLTSGDLAGSVVISHPQRDATIVMSIEDFRRLAAAVAHHTQA